MSVDHCPTCPDCGDDLVYVTSPAFSIDRIGQTPGNNGDWKCPDCGKWYDIPEGPLPEPEPE